MPLKTILRFFRGTYRNGLPKAMHGFYTDYWNEEEHVTIMTNPEILSANTLNQYIIRCAIGVGAVTKTDISSAVFLMLRVVPYTMTMVQRHSMMKRILIFPTLNIKLKQSLVLGRKRSFPKNRGISSIYYNLLSIIAYKACRPCRRNTKLNCNQHNNYERYV